MDLASTIFPDTNGRRSKLIYELASAAKTIGRFSYRRHVVYSSRRHEVAGGEGSERLRFWSYWVVVCNIEIIKHRDIYLEFAFQKFRIQSFS